MTGKQIYTGADFTIEPSVSFSLVAILSEGLPSAVEGRSAFRITESIVATVHVKFNQTVGKSTSSELLYVTHIDDLADPTSSDVENSMIYAKMGDEHKKKMQLRMRKLIEALAEKEAIESNAEMLVGSPAVLSDTEAKITEVKGRINNLLAVNATKPIIDFMPLTAAVDEYFTAFPDAEGNRQEYVDRLILAAHKGYNITG